MVDAPGRARADGLPARPRRRPPGRLRPRARADHRRRPDQDVPGAAHPDGQDPRVPAAHRGRLAQDAVPVLPRRLQGGRRRLQGPAPRDGRASSWSRTARAGLRAAGPPLPGGGLRDRLRAGRHRRDRQEAAQGGGSLSEGTDLARRRATSASTRSRIPTIQEPDDIIVRITSTGLCGSDLHLYTVLAPFLDEGDILGHEPMGIVEEVGPDVTELAGRRPRRHPVQRLLRRLLDVRPGPALAVRDDAGARVRHRRVAVRLHEALRPGARRPGGAAARAVRQPAADQGPRRPGRTTASCSCRDVLPTAWQGVEYARHPGRRHASCVLGLGPIGDMAVPHRRPPRLPADRRRPRAGAPRARPRPRASRRSTSTTTTTDLAERHARHDRRPRAGLRDRRGRHGGPRLARRRRRAQAHRHAARRDRPSR